MNFTLITCSKQSFDTINTLSKDYVKRISRFGKIQHHNIKPSSVSNISIRQHEDTKRMITKVPSQALIVYLDERGKSYTSKKFSSFISNSFIHYPNICFLIGPAVGFDLSLLMHYQSLQLSEMTLQHEHVQLLLLEQVYRALTLMHNHPYHL
ncbi:23S rRNA (pseudouridine(1915)-N(3))-methyltransferase RlmH [Gammaproteobacteria bacterium]|nr:23S rRNA (pseudouridine(1915)-N(3))-methyltransferase RlmH [Gammaproteobacteria bacterium]